MVPARTMVVEVLLSDHISLDRQMRGHGVADELITVLNLVLTNIPRDAEGPREKAGLHA